MGRIQTELKGITTTSVYEDGDMYSLVNLRRKGGALHPVAPLAVEQELCGMYDLYFIHKNEDYENWIGVVNREEDGTSDVYWNINATDCSEVKTLKIDTGDVINSIEQNGNMLIFVTNNTLFYALFRNGDYVWYGEMPELLPIQWSCYKEVWHHENDNPTDGLEQGDLGISYEHYYGGASIEGDVSHDQLLEYTQGLINAARGKLTAAYTRVSDYVYDDTSGNFGGLFFDAFFVRYAYRLYDGTHVKLSPPILIMPAMSILSLFEAEIVGGSYVAGTPTERHPFGGTNDWSYLSFDKDKSRVYAKGFVPGMNYDFSALTAYEGLIESVDIFMSPYIGISSPDNINTTIETTFDGGSGYDGERAPLIDKYTATMRKNAREMSSFYHVKSIDIGESTGGDKVVFVAPDDGDMISNIANLVHREQLIDDTKSSHDVGAKISYMYNNRLHLANTKTTYFEGFSYLHWRWGGDARKDSTNAPIPPQSKPETIPVNDPDSGSPFYHYTLGANPVFYNGFSIFRDSTHPLVFLVGQQLIIEVEIKGGGSKGYVRRVHTFAEADVVGFSSMLSYPDAHATKMRFYHYIPGAPTALLIDEISLIAHDFLDIAYYMPDEFRPFYLGKKRDNPLWDYPEVPALDVNSRFSFESGTELQVSDTYNPIRFQNANKITIGTGDILALGSNAMNVSGRHYGTYPLFVFSEDGVYSLQVGQGDVPYAAVNQPISVEPLVSGVICNLPQGIVFTTSRGLFLVNNSEVRFLSAVVEESPVDLNLEWHTGAMDDVLLNYGNECFRSYLKGLSGMLYNNITNEVVMFHKENAYNWVLSLDDLTFYVSTENIEHVVKNSYPATKVVSENKLLDFTKEEGEAHISLITRPMSYGTPDVKFLERIVMRCIVYNMSGVAGKTPITVAYLSNDSRNFIISKGLEMREGNMKDVDTGMYGRMKFRQYVFAIAGKCGQETLLEYIESESEKAYNNTKMR